MGPAHPYRGGIAAFNERLAREFIRCGNEVTIVTFTLQYPSFLFPGKTQFSTEPAPEDLSIRRMVNSVNPLSWIKAGLAIRKMKPDLVIPAFWHPYLAPALGSVARISNAPVTALLHNLMPHEHKPGDRMMARYFCRSCDSFVCLSESVLNEIRAFAPGRKALCRPHPLYDNFGAPASRDEACAKLGIDPSLKILLSFGLIREYKGLDWLLEAYASIKDRRGLKLVVAGEFYSDGERYHELARRLGIDSEVDWRTEFVPDSEVKYYFCAADLVVQPYKSATQSGITQIAYHFERPMLVTRVGGLAEIVPDGKAGYAVDPSPEAVAGALERFISENPDFSAGIREEKGRYSWARMAEAFTGD